MCASIRFAVLKTNPRSSSVPSACTIFCACRTAAARSPQVDARIPASGYASCAKVLNIAFTDLFPAPRVCPRDAGKYSLSGFSLEVIGLLVSGAPNTPAQRFRKMGRPHPLCPLNPYFDITHPAAKMVDRFSPSLRSPSEPAAKNSGKPKIAAITRSPVSDIPGTPRNHRSSAVLPSTRYR